MIIVTEELMYVPTGSLSFNVLYMNERENLKRGSNPSDFCSFERSMYFVLGVSPHVIWLELSAECVLLKLLMVGFFEIVFTDPAGHRVYDRQKTRNKYVGTKMGTEMWPN